MGNREPVQYMGIVAVAKRGGKLGTRSLAAALLFTLVGGHAQELDPMDPALIGSGVDRAEVVLIGTFKVTWLFPWIDGWHYRGVLHADEVLLDGGSGKRQIPFEWLERYGNRCLICERISQFNGKSGIWLLTRAKDGLRLSGTAATLCGGPLPAGASKLVREAIQRRRTYRR